MTRRRGALEILVAGLRGHVVEGTDWLAVIALANRTLLTPSLYAALARARQTEQLPQDVCDYLRFIYDCNRERNQRLRSQLDETVAALNRHAIVPILLKGAVPLFLARSDRPLVRITSDLDVGVAPAEEAAARACLAGLGYAPLPRGRELARPQDSGLLDLRPTTAEGSKVHRNGIRARVASPQSRALHWIVHDLLKEGDYWRGRIDLRHLYDLAHLSETVDVDWSAMRAAAPDQTTRNAIDTQLLALHHFFGARIPAESSGSALVRFQHWRRVLTATRPVIGAPLRLAGHLTWAGRRLAQSEDLAERGVADLARRAARTLLERRSKI